MAEESAAILECIGLGVEIGDVQVCHDLNLGIEPGQCWVILGRNGSGKTTLLQTLAGLRSAAQGEIHLNGRPLAAYSRRQIARRVGLLLQQQEDPFPASVDETVLQGRHPYLRPWQWESPADHQQAAHAVAFVGLENFRQRNIQTLSGGERQRVAIAELITQNPDLMLLDEPGNHLDLHHTVTILKRLVLQSKASDTAICMVLHDVNLAARLADHCLLLHGDGEIQAGPAQQVLNGAYLERLYGHPLQRLETAYGPAWLPE